MKTVAYTNYTPSVVLTGQIAARTDVVLSFRVNGPITEGLVDVGSHVSAGDMVAKLDPAEQQADLESAVAAEASAQGQLQLGIFMVRINVACVFIHPERSGDSCCAVGNETLVHMWNGPTGKVFVEV